MPFMVLMLHTSSAFQPWVIFFIDTLFFPPFLPTQDPGVNQKDTYVSEAMMTMWTQFAATGNPSVKGLVKWPAYNVSDAGLHSSEGT